MIVSHKHKFIFIKTRKTAGTSLEIALSKLCGDQDIITPISKMDEPARKSYSNRSAQNYKLPIAKYELRDFFRFLSGSRKGYYNHMGGKEIRNNISKEIWDSYYKFCFERNPYDKAVSLFYWQCRDGSLSFSEYLQKGGLDIIKGKDLYTENNEILLDNIYLYEDLDKALIEISNKLELDNPIEMPQYRAKDFTRKDKRHYSEIINSEDRIIIEEKFKWELEFLNYKF